MSSKIKINLESLQSRREWKRHKVKDGNNVYRILPPFNENSNGYPYRKWQIIWGLKDPQSGRPRPFASSMTSEKRCPITEYVATLKKKSETLKAQLQAAGATEEQMKDRLGTLNKLINDLSPKTVYIYNAVDKSGEVGLLELKSTAHKKMKTEMTQYIQDYNQDPTSLNSAEDDSGIWFNITRSGFMRDTEYDVKKLQKSTKNDKGRMVFEDDRSPLPESVVTNFSQLAYDLGAVYQIKSYDDLQAILDANFPDIIKDCPDADPNGDLSERQFLTTPETAAPKANGAGKVNIRLGDDEEDGVNDTSHVQTKFATPPANAASIDDDFLAEADRLLNT
jgi:hypothetical protein